LSVGDADNDDTHETIVGGKTLDVFEGNGPLFTDFSLSVVPDRDTVQWFMYFIGTVRYDVTVSSISGYSGTVLLSVTGMPVGTRRYYFDPTDAITVPPHGFVTTSLVVEVTRRTPVGNYILTVTGDDGNTVHSDDVIMEVTRPPRFPVVLAVKEGIVPEEYILLDNYPNPFNPETNIDFGLPENTKVTLKLYNVLGQVVKVLIDEQLEAGFYSVSWVAIDFPSGVYFYQIATDNFMTTKSMILMK
ncbi:MAG: T9SS type A sorting domain-containing protein, partial [Gemmatimonadota bacterium]